MLVKRTFPAYYRAGRSPGYPDDSPDLGVVQLPLLMQLHYHLVAFQVPFPDGIPASHGRVD